MKLFNTDLIPSDFDVFWKGQDEGELFASRPVLVITRQFTPGSEEGTQLRKMLEACKLSENQYHLVQMKEHELASWPILRERYQPRIVFLVGILPAQLGIAALFVPNQPCRFNDCVWLATASLPELNASTPLKTQLWNNGMKPIFIEQSSGKFF